MTKQIKMIGIAASSAVFSKEKFLKGVEVLHQLGFDVLYSTDIFRAHGYLAGTDERRAEELSCLLNDPDVDAVMFARGGYGMQRILENLDLSSFKRHQKLVIGYSDVTPLLSKLTNMGIPTVYGPVMTGLAHADQRTKIALKNILNGKIEKNIKIDKPVIIKPGKARGKLVGGCLTMLTTSIGTSYELDAHGAILFLEDVGEKIYRYDRFLTQLKNSGKLKNVKGIVFGYMGLDGKEKQKDLWKVCAEVLSDFKGPVVAGLKTGHGLPFISLRLGVKYELSVGKTCFLRQTK